MAQQRAVPPRLSIPLPQPQLSKSNTARFYPVFTPTPPNNALLFSPSPTPTPSKHSRSPRGPLWVFTLLHLLSLYVLHQWLSASPMPPPLVYFSFLVLFMTALCLNIIYRPWKGRRILSSQWGLLLISGALLGISYVLCFQGLQSSGPLETIFANFAGCLMGKVFLDSSKKRSETARKARGLVALLLGVFLLSHGWARMSCSPLAFDISYRTRINLISQSEGCFKLWPVFAPLLGGVLSALHRTIGAKTALKSIGKKRIQVISYATGSFVLFPAALFQLALVSGQSNVQYSSSFWWVASVVAFGVIISFYSSFYTEDKLFLPIHSLKAFQIVLCCVCGLELLYGLGISLVGFLFCSLVFGIGVQELALLQDQLSWEELGDMSYGSVVFASWIRRPLQHIMSDKKSRKIAIFLLINTGFMFVEFFYGFLSNSLGLISDACHMLFDCAALAIGLYASYIARLPENSKFNYGYGRWEVVSGYANAVLLVLVASLIVLESIERMLEPPEISTESLLVVSVGGLLVNIVGLIFFHEEHHHAHGHGGHSSCSHSHSIQKPLGLTADNTKVDLSAITSKGSFHSPVLTPGSCSSHLSLPSNHHSVAAEVSGNGFATIGADEGRAILQNHSHSSINHGADDVCNQEHEHHHDCQGHSPHNGNTYHQAHGFDHDGHAHHYHKHQHNDSSEQNGSNHNNSSNHDDFLSQRDCKHLSPHQDAHDHSHACGGGGHLHNHLQEHDRVNHRQQHVHGIKHADHDHLRCDHSHEHHQTDVHGIKHADHDHLHCDHSHKHDQTHDHHDGNNNHNHDDHHHMDHNMYGIFLHVLADTLGSVGVVISTLFIKYKGWLITDPACSMFLSALIIGSVIPLLRNTAEILLQRVPRHNERALKAAMKGVAGLSGVQSVSRAHVWNLTNTEIVGSLHVQLLSGSNRNFVQEQTLRLLHEAGIGDLSLQIEEASPV